jgi:hypothetical protein
MLRTDYGRGSRYVCTQCGNSVLVVPTQPATADEMSETRCNCTVHRHCVRCHGTDVVEGKVDVCVECGKEQPTPPAEGETAWPRPEHIYTAGWREGWEAAKLATHRIPNIAEALDAWRLSESKQAIRDGAEGETAEGLSAERRAQLARELQQVAHEIRTVALVEWPGMVGNKREALARWAQVCSEANDALQEPRP